MAAGKPKNRLFFFFSFVSITLTAIASTVEGKDDAPTALVAVEEQKRMVRNAAEIVNPAANGQDKNPPLARKKRQTCGVLCRISGRFSCAIVCSIFDDPLAIDACQNMCGGGVTRGRSEPLSSCALQCMNKPHILVCGYDLKTYDKCSANCHGILWEKPGACPNYGQLTSRLSCPCLVPTYPVCGEDGRTYPNFCQAECRDVNIVHMGPCVTPVGTCNCPRIYDPVCGDDGRKYNNHCLLECSGANYVGPAEFPDGTPRGCYYLR